MPRNDRQRELLQLLNGAEPSLGSGTTIGGKLDNLLPLTLVASGSFPSVDPPVYWTVESDTNTVKFSTATIRSKRR